MESDLQKHVEDMFSVLGGRVERSALEKELNLFVGEYRVSVPSAKRSIVKKYGGDPDALSLGVEKSIADIVAGEGSVDVSGRVVYATPREVTVSGEKKRILSGLIEDSTGSLPFTIWEYASSDVERGDLIAFRNAYTTTYREKPQLNVSSKSRYWVKEKAAEWKREARKIKDIQPNESNILFEGKIISIASRVVNSRGEEKEIQYGLVGDESRTVRFTAWKDFGISKGDVVRVEGAYSRERNGEIQVNLSERSTVEKLADREIGSVARFGTPRAASIADLREGMGNITVTGRVMSISEKEIEVQGETRSMVSGVLADATGKVSFTGWRDFPFNEGETVRISGAYVRSWKGVPQLKFDDKSEVAREEKELLVTAGGSTAYSIEALEERGGAMDAAVTATIIEVRQGTGLIFRCPQCSRTTKLGECRTHGQVEGVADFRVRLVVDDGTGSLFANLNREMSEALTGMTLDAVRKRTEQTLNQEAVIAEISSKVIFSTLKLSGNVFSDDFGLNMYASACDTVTPEVKQGAVKLYQEVIETLGM